MGTLYIFGCSFSETLKKHKGSKFNDGGFTAQAKYIHNFCNDDPPLGWSEILVEKLGMSFYDGSMGGASNQQIFMNFCEQSQNIRKNDIVIIGWTEIARFRWATSQILGNGWSSIFPGVKDQNVEGLSSESRNEILINRMKPQYAGEIHNIQTLIAAFSKSLNFKIFFWANNPDMFKDSNIDPSLLLCGGESVLKLVHDNGGENISEATGFTIMDGHLAKSGHQVQADLFYSHIQEHL
jgi:hypothetical protein